MYPEEIQWPTQRPSAPYLPLEEETDEEIQTLKAAIFDEVYAKEMEREKDRIFQWFLSTELPDDEATHRLEQRLQNVSRGVTEAAEKAAQRATRFTWQQIRQIIWERDQGICQVCGVSLLPELYECGHIIDRFVGGSDRLSNLVAMCVVCNQLKPFTESHDLYVAWASTGGPIWATAEMFAADPESQRKLFPVCYREALLRYYEEVNEEHQAE